MGININLKEAQKWLCKKSLYDFILEFWDAYETQPYVDCWIVEYTCECFMYSVKHFLPRYVWDSWIDDLEYETIKSETGGECPVRDKIFNNKPVHNHDWNIGPRHMKSSILNVCGPVWLTTNAPLAVASVSHTQRLSTEMNTKRQTLLESPKYKYYFGDDDNLKLKTSSKSQITLSSGAELYSVCMTSFTGFGADVIIADDLISADNALKDMQVLKNVISFFKNTLPTRLNTKTTGVIWQIQQRLARGDISGTIAKDSKLNQVYSHTEIPAIAPRDITYVYPCSGKTHSIKAGEYLWPERFGDYTSVIMEVGEDMFNTQYNQKASASTNNIIKDDYIHFIDDKEFEEYKDLAESYYTSHDCPVKDKEMNDFHGFAAGYGKGNSLVIDDAWEDHMGYVKEKELIRVLNETHPGVITLIEDKANGGGLLQDLAQEIPGLVGYNPGTLGKAQRLRLASTYMQSGAVRFRDTSHNRYLIEKLKDFPFVEHDDIVDAFTQLVLYHFTQHKAGVYTNSFTYKNIINTQDRKPDNKNCLYSASIVGNIIKLLKVERELSKDAFIVVEEHTFNGLQAFEDYCINSKINMSIMYDASYNNTLSKIISNPNIYLEKFVDKEPDKSIQTMRVGFYKLNILVSRDCKQTINDISKLRWADENMQTGSDKIQNIDEGFEGCLRAVIVKQKGAGAYWL